jgi:hypothetical protein
MAFGDAAVEDQRDASRDGAAGAYEDASPAVEAGTDAAATTVVDCTPDAGADMRVDPEVRAFVRGTNGDFQDSCDPAGNLTEYSCETRRSCGLPPNPPCETWETGKVVPQSIDCNGRCVDGTCTSRCPQAGDRLVYEAVGAANIVLENQTDHRLYVCESLGFDKPNDGYDCGAAIVGQEVYVVGIGMTGSFCTGGMFGNVAVGPSSTDERCAYLNCRFGN